MKHVLILLIALSAAACVSRSHSQDKVIKRESVKNSSLIISYNLGHSHYQFSGVAGHKKAEISSQRDDTILESKEISLDRYLKYARQVEKLMAGYKGKHAAEGCRTPFRISLASGGKTKSISGCRGDKGDAQVGHVIKQGEYLFYSRE